MLEVSETELDMLRDGTKETLEEALIGTLCDSEVVGVGVRVGVWVGVGVEEATGLEEIETMGTNDTDTELEEEMVVTTEGVAVIEGVAVKKVLLVPDADKELLGVGEGTGLGSMLNGN